MADPLEWMDGARCREVDTEIFFPPPGGNNAHALRVCRRCEVQQECLEYALSTPVMGVWGGTTSRQRQQMKGAAYRQRAS